MRILHFSDVHIGVENYGKLDVDTGLSTRLLDFLAAFDEVVSYAVQANVDLVLFCGDAYKSKDPTQTHQREFARRIARLSSAGIPVFLLVGNHDVPAVASRASALEIFPTLNVQNIYTGETLTTYRVPTRDGVLQIVALPWIRRSTFLAREDTRGLNAEEINEAIQRRLSQAIELEAQKLDVGLPAVFAGHVSVGGSKTGSEQSMMLGRDHVLLKSEVALPQFDYVALGHVHRHQVLAHEPYVVYSGSLQRVDFGEEQDDKGFCVIDIDPAAPRGLRVTGFEFKSVEARRFLTIKVKLRGGEPDPTDKVINAVMAEDVREAIVRVLIELPGELEGHLREADIRTALAEAHFVASISKEVTDERRVRLGSAYNEVLEPQEALKLYLESREVSLERAEVLMKHAAELQREDLG